MTQGPQMSAEDIQVVFDLNARRSAFVHAYLGPGRYNASRSALLAGYCPTSPRQSGHRVLHNPKVHAVVDKLLHYYMAIESVLD